MDHAYCLEPNQCICHVGWSGPTCDVCMTQPKCPEMGTCDEPAGCVCEESLDGRCIIQNNPPKFSDKKYNIMAKHKMMMRTECFRLNERVRARNVTFSINVQELQSLGNLNTHNTSI